MKTNLIDMKRFQTTKELQDYCNSQYETILSMQAKAEEYQTKIQHLEELLRSGDTTLTVGSSELEICKLEIGRLYVQSKQEPLTDQEVRKFDVLVKCLLAIQGKTGDIKPKKKDPVMTSEELIEIALKSMPTDDSQ